ncbi:hypothetical protein EYF80_009545 [Liparis tanakae]|uniref:Uncharacterized protein n=1 Tax=Liparis tanakae TaxID=230148 RepID=A0A4Z2IQF0_9TELE|nr:hypothetical protein EYF80_009545 [Liparis tanakae]
MVEVSKSLTHSYMETEPERRLRLRLRLRLGLELALGCQRMDANRPPKLIPAQGPHQVEPVEQRCEHNPSSKGFNPQKETRGLKDREDERERGKEGGGGRR